TLRTIEPAILKEGTTEEIKNFNDTTVKNFKIFMTVDEAKAWISKQTLSAYGLRNSKTPQVIMLLAKGFVQPNVTFDRYESEKRLSDAAKTVKDVVLKIKAGEIIVRHGSRYDAANIKLIRGIVKEKERSRDIYNFVGIFIIILLLIIVPFYFAQNFLPRFKPNNSDYILMAVTGLLMVMILRISLSLAPAITSVFFITLPPEALNYAIPVAGGVILLKLLLPSSFVLIFSIVVSAFAGLFVETNLHYAAFSFISNIAAMIMIGHVDRRSSIMKAGIYLGLVNAICVAGILLLGMGSIVAPTGVGEVLIYIACGFSGGIFSAFFAMIATPLAESISGHISDIKLLELSNLNHPLLRELIIRAPGTYHHSHLVGILAEAAAEKIGANPLLVRVGAYYHDIGKMRKPQYFIENSTGENKHEKLSPSMSSLILLAHVKDGMEMAKEGGLPDIIIDMIPQHHGTKLMSFFYDKAKQTEEDGKHAIDKKDFRYPGPRPQSREAAILMLADSTEAAVRSLKEKSSMRIQQTVQKIINECFAESQLDECDLTLRDLNLIAGSFTHILLGIYHQRIEYPKDREDEKENGKSHSSGGKSEVKVVDKEKMREVSNDKSVSSERNKAE
ncbi:MAG: HDIG domain-containing metalloprotein, partial [archaeon]